jgi:hypothetical protein
MDVMRLDFYSGDATAARRNVKGILFNVRYLKVHGDWALVCVDPVNADGKEIAEFRWGLLFTVTLVNGRMPSTSMRFALTPSEESPRTPST